MTKAYKFDLEVKGQHRIGNMNVSHLLMVITQCTKYGKPVSNQKIVMGQTEKHVKNSINWETHAPNMVSQCQTKKNVMGQTRNVKTPIKLTFRSKFKVVSGSWMYLTHPLMVIQPCAKYGKPMSNQRKVMDWTQISTQMDRWTDRWTDGQTEWFLFTPMNLVHRRYKY